MLRGNRVVTPPRNGGAGNHPLRSYLASGGPVQSTPAPPPRSAAPPLRPGRMRPSRRIRPSDQGRAVVSAPPEVAEPSYPPLRLGPSRRIRPARGGRAVVSAPQIRAEPSYPLARGGRAVANAPREPGRDASPERRRGPPPPPLAPRFGGPVPSTPGPPPRPSVLGGGGRPSYPPADQRRAVASARQIRAEPSYPPGQDDAVDAPSGTRSRVGGVWPGGRAGSAGSGREEEPGRQGLAGRKSRVGGVWPGGRAGSAGSGREVVTARRGLVGRMRRLGVGLGSR